MKVSKRLTARLGLGLGLMLTAGGAAASSSGSGWGALNMSRGVNEYSAQVYDLHMLIFWICTVIGALVFGLILWSVFHHRKSRGVTAAQFHHNTAIEVAWTVVPMLILIAMAIPATRTLIDMHDTTEADMTIKVTGYQWMWHYDYIDEGVGFFSRLHAEHDRARQLGSGIDVTQFEEYLRDVDNPLVVPVNQKIRFLLTSNDVIHSWWVPQFGWKRDAIPGFVNEAWTEIREPGVYRGQCAELCGRDHAFMPIVVVAMEQDEYQQWLSQQQGGEEAAAPSAGVPPTDSVPTGSAAEESVPTAPEPAGEEPAVVAELSHDELMQRGEQVYNQTCVACHQAKGQGMPPAFPALTGSEFVTGAKENVIQILLNGRGAMPAFGGQMSDADVAAVATYVRNSFGNDTGDTVEPAEVQAAR